MVQLIHKYSILSLFVCILFVSVQLVHSVSDTELQFFGVLDSMNNRVVDSNGTSLTGNGVSIGLITTGVASYNSVDIPNEIKNDVATYVQNFGDGTAFDDEEGAAILEILHDVSPNSTLYAATITTSKDIDISDDYIDAIDWLIAQGVDIIISHYHVPNVKFLQSDGDFYYTGQSAIAKKISDTVLNNDIPFIISSGNSAELHYQDDYSGDANDYHQFSGVNNALITVDAQSTVALILTWDEPHGFAETDLDLYLVEGAIGDVTVDLRGLNANDTSGSITLATKSVDLQNGVDSDPFEVLIYENSSASPIDMNIVVEHQTGPENVNFELFVYPYLGVSLLDQTAGSSLSTPADATAVGVITVGAVDIVSYSPGGLIEGFSSQGPTNDFRIKPDVLGPDNFSTSLADYNPFPGTSAAAPMVAGVVALMKEAAPGLSAQALYYSMIQTSEETTSYGTEQPNNSEGYGFVKVQEVITFAENLSTQLSNNSYQITNETITLTPAGHPEDAIDLDGFFINTGSDTYSTIGSIELEHSIRLDPIDDSNEITIDLNGQITGDFNAVSFADGVGYTNYGTISNATIAYSEAREKWSVLGEPSARVVTVGRLAFGLNFANSMYLSFVDTNQDGQNEFGVEITDITSSLGTLNMGVSTLALSPNGALIESGSIELTNANMALTFTNASVNKTQIQVESATAVFGDGSIELTEFTASTDGTSFSFDTGEINAYGFTVAFASGSIDGDGNFSVPSATVSRMGEEDVLLTLPAFSITDETISVSGDFQTEIAGFHAMIQGGLTFSRDAVGFDIPGTASIALLESVTMETTGLSLESGLFSIDSGSLALNSVVNFDVTGLEVSSSRIAVDSASLDIMTSELNNSYSITNFVADSETNTIQMDPPAVMLGNVSFDADFLSVVINDDNKPVISFDQLTFNTDLFDIEVVSMQIGDLGGSQFIDLSDGGSISVGGLGTFSLQSIEFDSSMFMAAEAEFTLEGDEEGNLVSIAFTDLNVNTSTPSLSFTTGNVVVSELVDASFGNTSIDGSDAININNASLMVGGFDGAASVQTIDIGPGMVTIENGEVQIVGFDFGFSVSVVQDGPFSLAVEMEFPQDKLPWPSVAGSIGIEPGPLVNEFSLAVEGGSLPGTDLGLNHLSIAYQRVGTDYGITDPVIAGAGEFAIPNYFTVGMGAVFFDRCMDQFWVSVSDMNLALGNSGVFFQDIFFGAGGFCGLYDYPCTEITYETKWDADVDENGNTSTNNTDTTTNSMLDSITSGSASGGYLLPVNVSFRAEQGLGGVIVNPGSVYTRAIVSPYGSGDDEYYRTCEIETEVPGCDIVLTFELGIALSAGPRVNGVALAELQANGKFDTTGWMLISGDLVILSFDVAGAEFEINPSGPDQGVRAAMYVNLLSVLKGDAEVRIDSSKRVSGNASASLGIPEDVPIIGGKDLGTVKASFGDSKISGSAEIKIIKTISFGFRFEDGRVSFNTKTQAPVRNSLLAGQLFNHGYSFKDEENRTVKFLTNWNTIEVDTPSPRNEPYFKPSASTSSTSNIRLNRTVDSMIVVVQAAGGTPDVELSSPVGITYTTDWITDPNVEELDFSVDTSGLTSSTTQAAFATVQDGTVSFLLLDPPLGNYTVNVVNSSDLAEISVEALLPNAKPAVAIHSVSKDTSGNYTIDYSAFDIDNDAQIEFYLDSDYEGGDGIRVAETVESDGNGTVTFNPTQMDANTASDPEIISATDWNGDNTVDAVDFALAEAASVRLNSPARDSMFSIPSGIYYLAAKIDDDANAPVITYGERIDITNPNAPSKPQNVEVKSVSGGLLVTWEGVTDPNNDLVGYKVLYSDELDGIRFGNSIGVDLRNSNHIADVTPFFNTPTTFALNTTPKQHSVIVPELMNGCPYRLAVVAYDSERNDSQLSDVVFGAPIDGSGFNYPHITSEPVLFARAGQPYIYEIEARDFDEGKFTVTLDHGPSWLSYVEVPLFEFTQIGDGPSIGQLVGVSHQLTGIPSATEVEATTVSVTVTDSTGLFTSQEFTLQTAAPIEAVPEPLICSRPDYTAYENRKYEYQLIVCQNGRIALSDLDTIQATMRSYFQFELIDAPAGMTLNPGGLIEWTPTSSQIGSHRVLVKAVETGALAENPPRSGVQAYHVVVQSIGDVMQNGGPVDNTFVQPTLTPTPVPPTPTGAITLRPITRTPIVPTPTNTSRHRFITFRPTILRGVPTSSPTPTPRFGRVFIGELIDSVTTVISNAYLGVRDTQISSNNNLLFVLDENTNILTSNRFNSSDGSITSASSFEIGSRPLQFTLSPDEAFGVLASEDGMIRLIGVDASSGGLSQINMLQLQIEETTDVAAGLAVSPDNQFIYATGRNSESLFTINRNINTNALSIVDRIDTNLTSNITGNLVSPSQQEQESRNVLVITTDGNFVYQLTPSSSTVIAYSRNTDGTLEFRQSINLNTDGLSSLTISPDQSRLLVKSDLSGNLIVIQRDRVTGRMNVSSRVSNAMLQNSRALVYDPDEPVFYTVVPQGIAVFAEDLEADPVLVNIIRSADIISLDEQPLALEITPDGSVLIVIYPSQIVTVRLQKERILIPTSTPTVTPTTVAVNTPTPQKPNGVILHDMVIAQGEGGQNLVQVRKPNHQIVDQYRALNNRFIESIGGGTGRSTYVTTGDINNDGVNDYINTFGPAKENGLFPSIVTAIDSQTKRIIGHSFSPFPPGTGSPIRYNGGELRTAIGKFISTNENLLAVAQGNGSEKSIVRIFRYTGEPAPRAWQIVTQLQPLDNRPTTNNANGGVTVTAGDIDGDGLDELIAGQTSSETSLTQFTVIDIDPLGQNHKRHNFVAFPPGFRGSGGTELVVVDLNGDGQNEIVATSMGVGNTTDTPNVISVIKASSDGVNINFSRPATSILQVIGDQTINPGGGLSIAAGELDGDVSNGQELIIGSGKGAPQSFYRMLKILYDPAEGDNGTVTDFFFLNGPPKNLNFVQPAFIDNFNPASGAVHVAAFPKQTVLDDNTPTPKPTLTPTFPPTPTRVTEPAETLQPTSTSISQPTAAITVTPVNNEHLPMIRISSKDGVWDEKSNKLLVPEDNGLIIRWYFQDDIQLLKDGVLRFVAVIEKLNAMLEIANQNPQNILSETEQQAMQTNYLDAEKIYLTLFNDFQLNAEYNFFSLRLLLNDTGKLSTSNSVIQDALDAATTFKQYFENAIKIREDLAQLGERPEVFDIFVQKQNEEPELLLTVNAESNQFFWNKGSIEKFSDDPNHGSSYRFIITGTSSDGATMRSFISNGFVQYVIDRSDPVFGLQITGDPNNNATPLLPSFTPTPN